MKKNTIATTTTTTTTKNTTYSFKWFKGSVGKLSKKEIEGMKEIWTVVKAQRMNMFSMLCNLHEMACDDEQNLMMVDPVSNTTFDSDTMFNGIHEGVEHMTKVIMGSMMQSIYALCMARGAERFDAIRICHDSKAIIHNDVVATVQGKGGIKTDEIQLKIKGAIKMSKMMKWNLREDEE